MQLPYDSAIVRFRHLSQSNENLCSYKHFYTRDRSSFIHNSSKLDTIQVTFNG